MGRRDRFLGKADTPGKGRVEGLEGKLKCYHASRPPPGRRKFGQKGRPTPPRPPAGHYGLVASPHSISLARMMSSGITPVASPSYE